MFELEEKSRVTESTNDSWNCGPIVRDWKKRKYNSISEWCVQSCTEGVKDTMIGGIGALKNIGQFGIQKNEKYRQAFSDRTEGSKTGLCKQNLVNLKLFHLLKEIWQELD